MTNSNKSRVNTSTFYAQRPFLFKRKLCVVLCCVQLSVSALKTSGTLELNINIWNIGTWHKHLEHWNFTETSGTLELDWNTGTWLKHLEHWNFTKPGSLTFMSQQLVEGLCPYDGFLWARPTERERKDNQPKAPSPLNTDLVRSLFSTKMTRRQKSQSKDIAHINI